MAQNEDTELRDMVIEALEKNGSLPKIRALLRANIFLAFEDECNNVSHNTSLDKILKIPEGILCLTLIHEFLEFCNLRNTMFVYVAETRQGKEYVSDSRKNLAEKLNLFSLDNQQEPILLSIVKNFLKPFRKKHATQGDHTTEALPTLCDKHNQMNMKDEQNSTYIVHEDSSSTSSQSQSQSDNSLDEKNKSRGSQSLPLDTSDTDSSTDSNRDKTHSEYIPNQKNCIDDSEDNKEETDNATALTKQFNKSSAMTEISDVLSENLQIHDNIINTFNSSDSTSYAELDRDNYIKHSSSEVLKNLSTLLKEDTSILKDFTVTQNYPSRENSTDLDYNIGSLRGESASSNGVNKIQNITIMPVKGESSNINKNMYSQPEPDQNMNEKESPEESVKSELDTPEYSFNFTPSPRFIHNVKSLNDEHFKSADGMQENAGDDTMNKDFTNQRQTPNSSQSSASISDIADLLEQSEISSIPVQSIHSPRSPLLSNVTNIQYNFNYEYQHKNGHKSPTDLSENFSSSPVPSLSNLSLEVHSD